MDRTSLLDGHIRAPPSTTVGTPAIYAETAHPPISAPIAFTVWEMIVIGGRRRPEDALNR
jgi:hypothetical protein